MRAPGHTFAIHCENEALVTRFAMAVPASRILVNTSASLGGVGATTNLFPALTLGCGSAGGSSSSNNIGPKDLINIKRVAWGVKELDDIYEEALKCDVPLLKEQTAQDDAQKALIAQITARVLRAVKAGESI